MLQTPYQDPSHALPIEFSQPTTAKGCYYYSRLEDEENEAQNYQELVTCSQPISYKQGRD